MHSSLHQLNTAHGYTQSVWQHSIMLFVLCGVIGSATMRWKVVGGIHKHSLVRSLFHHRFQLPQRCCKIKFFHVWAIKRGKNADNWTGGLGRAVTRITVSQKSTSTENNKQRTWQWMTVFAKRTQSTGRKSNGYILSKVLLRKLLRSDTTQLGLLCFFWFKSFVWVHQYMKLKQFQQNWFIRVTNSAEGTHSTMRITHLSVPKATAVVSHCFSRPYALMT